MVIGDTAERPQASARARRRWPRPVTAVIGFATGAVLVFGVMLGAAAMNGSRWTQCPDAARQASDGQQLRALVQTELTALVAADTSQLDRLLAADFSHITPNGDTWTRQDLRDWLASGSFDFRSIVVASPIDIRWNCRTAVVSFRSDIRIKVDLDDYRHPARHTEIWEQRDGRWTLVLAQISAIGGFPPPGQ